MEYTPQHWQAMRLWLEGATGQHFVSLEKKVVGHQINKFFGSYALLLGEPVFVPILMQNSIKHHVIVNPVQVSNPEIPWLCARQDKLPVASESIDEIYLAHCMEFLSNPHEVLRESYRILRPGGHVIITMFNPLGLWGIWRLFAQIYDKAPWRGNFMSALKMRDWLALLGFDIIQANFYGYCLPIRHKKIVRGLSFCEKIGQKFQLPFSAAFSLVGCKRVIGVTPIPAEWQVEQTLRVGNLVEPSAHGCEQSLNDEE